MNDKPPLEDQPVPVNGAEVVPIGTKRVEDSKTFDSIQEFAQIVLKQATQAPPHPAAILANLEIQGLQLETLMRMIFEEAPLTAEEFNRRLRLRCRLAVQSIKARPAIIVAKDLPPRPL